MGFIPAMPPECGEYSVEIRRESFYLRGEDGFEQTGEHPCPQGCDVVGPHAHGEWGYVEKRHALFVYPNDSGMDVPPTLRTGQGTVEILLEDIPKVMACLRLVAEHEGITLDP